MIARFVVAGITLAFLSSSAFAQPLDGRMKKIKDTKSIALAYRTDAAPFSFVDDNKQPVGYTVDLCKRIVGVIEKQLGVQGLQVKWVPVTTQTRFDAVAKGDADMECGASTVTLGRMKQVDFSNFIFVDGTGLVVRKETNARTLADLGAKKIGVVRGTTNEKAINAALKDRMVTAFVVGIDTRDVALAKLEAGEIDAFASDMILLLGLSLKAKDLSALRMLEENYSFEPYGIALPRGDAGLRLAVNTALAQIYSSPAISDIFGSWFGAVGKPTGLLRAMYVFGALSE